VRAARVQRVHLALIETLHPLEGGAIRILALLEAAKSLPAGASVRPLLPEVWKQGLARAERKAHVAAWRLLECASLRLGREAGPQPQLVAQASWKTGPTAAVPPRIFGWRPACDLHTFGRKALFHIWRLARGLGCGGRGILGVP